MSNQKSKNMTREEIARIEIGHTEVSPGLARTMTVIFLILIVVVPITRLCVERYRTPSRVPQPFDIFSRLPSSLEAFRNAEGCLVNKTLAANAELLEKINAYEDALEEESLLNEKLLSSAQWTMLKFFGQGNEDAYPGRKTPSPGSTESDSERWLFYRPGVDYVTGPPFLDPFELKKRSLSGNEYTAPPQPDPRKAILDFHQYLSGRGIDLLILPTTVKAQSHPDGMTRRYARSREPLRNASFEKFKNEMSEAGVLVFDPTAILAEHRRGEAVDGDSEDDELAAERDAFLRRDTHWTPAAMDRVSLGLARFIEEQVDLAPTNRAYRQTSRTVTASGDIALMLRLPEWSGLFEPQRVRIQPVWTANSEAWRASDDGEVLVLGDSFSNIFSLGAMGWGEGAGLVERLSYHLQRGVRRIVRNDAAAYATREMLARDLARGRDRLNGVKVVVWQFAIRELAVGDWKMIPMELGEPGQSEFLTPEPGGNMIVKATVEALSSVPRPGSVPYKDHILSAHLVDVNDPDGRIENREAVVYFMSMSDNVWTPAARLRVGDQIKVRLRNWEDVTERFGAINRSELDDFDLQLEPPCWGEEID